MIETNNSSSSTNTLVTTAGAAVTVLNANTYRRGGLIQNLNTAKLYVKKGTGCSDADFTMVLAPGAGADDGYGGSLALGNYKGPVSIYHASSVRCMVSEDK